MARLVALLVGLALLVTGCAAADAPEPDSSTSSTTSPEGGSEDQGGDDEMDAPDPASLPEATAPNGIGAVVMPADAAAIQALFDRMPATVQALTRTEMPGGDPAMPQALYETAETTGCGVNAVQAQDVSTGDFYPEGWSAEKLVAMFTTGADWKVEDFGRDGETYWVRFNTTCGEEGGDQDVAVRSTVWGRAGSAWVFSATAGSTSDRAALTSALLAVADAG